MYKILVIGCKGFIGKHVFNYFSNSADYECWGCGVSVDYVTERYIQVDASNNDFNEIFENDNFYACINCSGAASVAGSFQNPMRDFNLNTLNVMRLLDAIRKHNKNCKFINLSSAAVYGNPQSLPIAEHDVCNPVSPYGYNKLFAEKCCQEFYTYFGLKTCSLRIFSAYGPGLEKQLLWDIYRKTLHEPEIFLAGTGNETRDFIFIDDIVKAVEIIMHKGDFEAGVYNIANGESVTVKEVAEKLLLELKYRGSIKFSGLQRVGDPAYWKADVSKLNSLNFVRDYDITKGIEKLVTWLKGLE